MRIVVIEDDEALGEVLRIALLSGGYGDVVFARDGLSGFDLVATGKPDLVLLDLMLPGMNGYDVCRAIRSDERVSDVPVIMLTAKSEECDIVKGLDLGANDYVTKPFSRPVLLARIRAALRTNAGGEEILSCDGLELDRRSCLATLDGGRVTLTPGEFRLLEALMSAPGRVLTRSTLLGKIQQENRDITERTVDVMLAHMRPKLGDWSAHIETARGVGYRFIA